MAETDSRVLEFLEEGLFLYGVGKVQEAIQRWRKVLELDPRNERALDYIESAGGDVSAFRKAAAASPAPAPAQPASSFTPSFAPQAPAPMPTQAAPPRAAAPPPPANAPPPLPWQGQAPAGGNPFAGFGPAPVAAPPAPARAPAPVVATPVSPPPRAPAPITNEITALSPTPPADTRDDLLRKAAALFRAQQHEMALELLERIAREFPPMDDTLRGYLDATRAAVLSLLRGQWARMDRIPRQRMTPAQMMQLHMTPEAGFLLSRIDGMSTIEDILSIAGLEELVALRALSTLVQNGVIELA